MVRAALLSLIATRLALGQASLAQDPSIPSNLQITTFASGLNFPYGLYQLPDGSLLVATSESTGALFNSTLQIKRFTTAASGSANPPTTVFNGPKGPATGMAGAGNVVAVATGLGTGSQILILIANEAGALTQVGGIAFQYPTEYWAHNSHTVALRALPGQPGTYQLVFGVGSSYNDIPTPGTFVVTSSGLISQTLYPESLYSVQFTVVGSAISANPALRLAKGLRNAFSLAFGANGDIYLADNGQNDPVTDVATSADVFAMIPAGVTSLLDFGFPGTFLEASTGDVTGPTAGITLPSTAFVPLNGVRRQGASGLALAPPGFPAGLNKGVFVGFYGSGNGRSMNPLVYLNPASGQFFDFIPAGLAGVSRLLSVHSTNDTLYVADLVSNGNPFQPGLGVIYKVSQAIQPPVTEAAPDRSTQGSWPVKYGTDGYSIAGGARNIPSYATLDLVDSTFVWSGLTSDSRALQSGLGSSNRLAGTWLPMNYSNYFDIRLSLTDGKPHQLALYFLDWDTNSRNLQVTVTDPATGQVALSKTISNFSSGEYLVLNLRGTFVIRVAGAVGSPVLSGIFFDPVAVPKGFTLSATPATASFTSAGTSTVSVTPVNGFNGTVTLAASNWPAGITGSFGVSAVSINVASNVVPGQYSLIVVGTSATITAATTIWLKVDATPSFTPGFTLSATPAAVTAGSSGTSTVTVTPVNGFIGAESYTASGWPAGITPSFASNIVTISVASGVAAGPYTLSLVGTSGALTASTTIALTVVGPAPSFTLSATPATVTAGTSGTSTVTVTPVNGFNGAVSYTASGWPAGITGSFASNIVTISVASGVAAGPYTLSLVGTSGALTASTTIALTVVGPAPSFTLNATPATVTAGSSGTSTVTVTPVNGFNGAVSYTASGWPAGITGSFASNIVTISVASGVAAGPYTLSLVGTSGALTASTTIALTVVGPAPSFTLNATPATVTAGSSGTSTVTVTPVNGFNGAVSYAASVWPAGITGSFASNIVTISVASGVAAGPYTLSLVGTSGALTASTSIPLTVAAPPVASGPSASFIGLDAAAQGAWVGNYGGDGYVIANLPASLPAYASVDASGVSTYTWAQLADDVRALQLSRTSPTPGIASSYYGSNFNFRVNFSDTIAHQVAIYLLDWDTTLRSESITILDAATNAVLDSRSFTNFHDGKYAVWNIRGNVVIRVSNVGGPNAVVSGLFFGVASGVAGQPSFSLAAAPATAVVGSTGGSLVAVTPFNGFNSAVSLAASGWPAGISGNFATNPATSSSALTITVGAAVAPGVYSLAVNGTSGSLSSATTITLTVLPAPSFGLSATAATAAAGAVGTSTVSVAPLNGFSSAVTLSAGTWPAGITGTFGTNPASTNSMVTISVGSSVLPGFYLLPVNGSSSAFSASASIALTVTGNGGSAGGPFATFLGLDTATQGAWIGKYGAAGFQIANGPEQAATFASVSIPGALTYSWAKQTTDARALRLSAGSAFGIASCYTQYVNNNLNINVNVTDGNAHQVAIYLLDWDRSTRSQTVTILDGVSNAVLDTRPIANSNDGVYGVWSFKGSIVIRVSPSPNSTVVVSGVFLN